MPSLIKTMEKDAENTTESEPGSSPTTSSGVAEEDVPLFEATVYLPEGSSSNAVQLSGIPVGNDAAATVRQMLAEHPLSCMFTSYRMDLECGSGVKLPLNDLSDLASVADDLLSHSNVIRCTFEGYDVRRARAHVRRFRDVLQRPPVQPHKLKAEPGEAAQTADSSDSAAAPPAGSIPTGGSDIAISNSTDPLLVGFELLRTLQNERDVVAHAQAALLLPTLPVPVDLSLLYPVPQPTDPAADSEAWLSRALAYQSGTGSSSSSSSGGGNAKSKGSRKSRGGDDAAPSPSASSSGGSSSSSQAAAEPLVQCLRSMTLSGYNPPPAPRRMQGDLLYIRIETLDGHVLHVTCSPTAWFVNRCSDDGIFDPAPAHPSYSSRTLWTLLHRASPAFRKAYQTLLTQAAASAAHTMSSSLTAFDSAFAAALAPAMDNITSAASFANDGATATSTSHHVGGGDVLTTTSTSADTAAVAGSAVRIPASTYMMAAAPSSGFAVCKPPCLLPLPDVPGAAAAKLPAALSSSSAAGAGAGASPRSAFSAGEAFDNSSSTGGSSASASAAASAAVSCVLSRHTFDLSRAEDDANCAWGMDDRGALRDWNEEWQSAREMPRSTPSERLQRARNCTKILSDFVDAATLGAMAIVNGSIAPLNAAEDPKQHVFVYNNIFFSLVMDARAKEADRLAKAKAKADAAAAAAANSASASAVSGASSNESSSSNSGAGPSKTGGGGNTATGSSSGSSSSSSSIASAPLVDDVASLASPDDDLAGVRALQRADVPGLHTLATALIGYNGFRVVAQSIIPGILQAETASKMVYGSTDSGATVACDGTMAKLMRSAGDALHIAERVYTPTSTSVEHPRQHAPSSTSVGIASAAPAPIVGPIECKGIMGSDGRYYVLDVVRMTPRDPLYYDALAATAAATGTSTADDDALVAAALTSTSTASGEAAAAVAAAAGAANAPAAAAAAVPQVTSSSSSPSTIAPRTSTSAMPLPSSTSISSSIFDGAYSAILRPELIRQFQAFVGTQEGAEFSAAAGVEWTTTTTEVEVAAEGTALPLPATSVVAIDAAAAASAGDATTSGSSGSGTGGGVVKRIPFKFNVNVFTRFSRDVSRGNAPLQSSDETAVRLLGSYLSAYVIPSAFNELRRDPIPSAVDGEGLTRFLHARGINIRYLGRLADMAAEREGRGTCPPFVLELLETEAVARVAKRRLDDLMRDTAVNRGAPATAIAAFLNALLGGAGSAAAAAATTSSSSSSSATAAAAPSSASATEGAQLQLGAAGGAGGGSGGKGKAGGKSAGKHATAATATAVASRAAAAAAAATAAGGESSSSTPAASAPAAAAAAILTTITVGNVSIAVPKISAPSADIPTASEATRKRIAADLPCVGDAAQLWTAIAAQVKAAFWDYKLRIWGAGGGAPAGEEGDQHHAGSIAVAAAGTAAAGAIEHFPSSSSKGGSTGGDEKAAAAAAASVDSSGGGGTPSIPSPASRRHRVALLRRVCQRAGIQILSRSVDWGSPAPFVPEDILGLFPVVKTCVPPSLSEDASDLHAAGRVAAAGGDLKTAYGHMQEAVALFYHVGGGPMHLDVAHACVTLATIFFHAGDPSSAVQQQARAVALFERLCGPDSVEAALAHGALGTYYSALGAAPAAVRHLSRCVAVLQLGGPPTHPEVAAAYMKLGSALRDAHHVTGANRCFNEALQRSRWDAPTAGSALQSLALTYALAGSFKDALALSRSALSVFTEQMGEGSPLVRDATFWVSAYATKAVELEKAAALVRSKLKSGSQRDYIELEAAGIRLSGLMGGAAAAPITTAATAAAAGVSAASVEAGAPTTSTSKQQQQAGTVAAPPLATAAPGTGSKSMGTRKRQK